MGIFILIFSYTYIVIDLYFHTTPPKIRTEKTKLGNPYENLEEAYPIENGMYIGREVCWKEMKMAWNERSSLPFDSLDKQGNILKFTLLRYLNSKHLRKDYEGIEQLSDADMAYIEKGFANVEYTKKFSLKKRIYKVLWEYSIYKKEGKVKESSGVKRLFLWETGLHIISRYPFFGVGTGDVKNAFANQLIADNSPLKDGVLRSHNQYISIAIAFGIIGFLWFVFAAFYPFLIYGKQDFLLTAFFIIYISSMLWEDSLETQIGVTIFAFFYPFYLFQNPFSKG